VLLTGISSARQLVGRCGALAAPLVLVCRRRCRARCGICAAQCGLRTAAPCGNLHERTSPPASRALRRRAFRCKRLLHACLSSLKGGGGRHPPLRWPRQHCCANMNAYFCVCCSSAAALSPIAYIAPRNARMRGVYGRDASFTLAATLDASAAFRVCRKWRCCWISSVPAACRVAAVAGAVAPAAYSAAGSALPAPASVAHSGAVPLSLRTWRRRLPAVPSRVQAFVLRRMVRVGIGGRTDPVRSLTYAPLAFRAGWAARDAGLLLWATCAGGQFTARWHAGRAGEADGASAAFWFAAQASKGGTAADGINSSSRLPAGRAFPEGALSHSAAR